jgi:hypothetical protein
VAFLDFCESLSECEYHIKSSKHQAENAYVYLKTLQQCCALDLVRPKVWQGLEPVLSDAISRVKQTAIGKVSPANFGFSRIWSQSGSHVKSATIISEAMDDVILQTKNENHRELI